MYLKQFFLAVNLLALCAMPALSWAAGKTTRESVATDGSEGNGNSGYQALSLDGRYLAFASDADNLVPDDTNGMMDVFVRDRWTGTVTRVSVASDGTQANYNSDQPVISADGRYVAFVSGASNLVLDDTNFMLDVFVHDTVSGETRRVSVTSAGVQANFLSTRPAISADGRYIAFESYASNLVANDANNYVDVFVHDRVKGETGLVSMASDGTLGDGGSGYADISADGRYVVFASDARNLVASDTNARSDVFLHDRKTGQTTRISKGYDGSDPDNNSYTPVISGNGRYVAYQSFASNLVVDDPNLITDIFVYDRQTDTTTLESLTDTGLAPGSVFGPAISADGRYVAFHSPNGMVADDTNSKYDVYLRDRLRQTTTRVSVASDRSEGDSASQHAAISGDGRYIAFDSTATNLVPTDVNGAYDVFVRDQWLLGAKKADLAVDMVALDTPVSKGQQYRYRITVTNNGPAPATQVNLLGWNDAGHRTRWLKVVASQGSCSKTAITVCRLGKLGVGKSATVLLTYKALAPARITQHASVTAAPRDPKMKNNARTVTLKVSRP